MNSPPPARSLLCKEGEQMHLFYSIPPLYKVERGIKGDDYMESGLEVKYLL
jgi:hypothetical protein